jgi:Mor family transcriptional regulator
LSDDFLVLIMRACERAFGGPSPLTGVQAVLLAQALADIAGGDRIDVPKNPFRHARAESIVHDLASGDPVKDLAVRYGITESAVYAIRARVGV